MKSRFLILLGVSLGMAALAPLVGLRWIWPQSLWGAAAEMDTRVLWDIRLPRVCLAFLAGAGLSVGGMVFQALFRNSLATPYTLGLSSGASLGAGLYVVMGLPATLLGIPGASLAAFAGSLLAIMLVYGLTLARQGTSPGTLLLAGVAASFFFSSALLAVQASASVFVCYRFFLWLVGSLDSADWSKVRVLAPFLGVGLALIIWRIRDLDQFLAGESLALSRGVPTRRVRRDLFLGVSIVVGAVVSVCGPIGFVGLMVPHMVRMLIGPDHRWLTPSCLLAGGGFLTACDALSRFVVAPVEIPVGVVTALLGGPFFLWLLVRKGNSNL
jgi:iron complex transport system permease protein